MAISIKVGEFISKSSWIRKMFEEGMRLKKEYGVSNVFDFSLGNPNVAPPNEFRKILLKIASDDIPGIHGYMPNAGFQETREAIASSISREHNVNIGAEHVVMTCGAAGALNVIFKVLLDPGDEVLIPTPCFMEYQFYIDNADGITRFVKKNPDFSLDLDAMDRSFTEKTKAVLINSPNNPTGIVYNDASIRGLSELLNRKSREYKKDIYLISDEPYRDIIFDDIVVPSIFSIYSNSIIATSFSKSLSLPGERIGFLAVNPSTTGVRDLMSGLIMYNRVLGFVNAPAIMQRVVSKLLNVKVNVSEYKKKRDTLCDGLAALGYKFEKPQGAFYIFPRTPIEDDIEFVKALQRRRILTVPGSGFGCPGHFRIAFCVDDETIVNAMNGFGDAIREFIR